jgi:hypothetical protein
MKIHSFLPKSLFAVARIVIVLTTGHVFAESKNSTAHGRTCGTVEYTQLLEQQNPLNRVGRMNAEKLISRKLAEAKEATLATELITIPVVVHVVYNNASENISDEDIHSQIAVLNRDFRKLNPDISQVPGVFQSFVADIGIEFCLSTLDPQGNPSNGITRTSTNHGPFYLENDVKYTAQGGQDVWDPDRFLNIWVCGLSGGLLGYAQPPGMPSATDGVVIDADYFGDLSSLAPFDKGRTCTHELGHYFNLRHIWGDEPLCSLDDGVEDTPQQKGSNLGCPSFPLISGNGAACSGTSPGAMFMNYMDYTDDACMFMFTYGQKSLMRAALDGPRASLKTAANCNGPQDCDTLSNLVTGDSLVMLGITPTDSTWGYVAGHNSYGDIGKAELFSNINIGTKRLKGFLVDFSRMSNSSGNFQVKVYQSSNGLPGNVLRNMNATYSQEYANVMNNELSYFDFPVPLVTPASFFGAIEFTYAAGDTLAISTSTNQPGGVNSGFEKISSGTWQSYSTPNPQGWGLNLKHFMWAVFCDVATGEIALNRSLPEASMFPNPCSDLAYVNVPENMSGAKISVFDMFGREVLMEQVMPGIRTLDVSSLVQGYYVLQMTGTGQTLHKTFLVNR